MDIIAKRQKAEGEKTAINSTRNKILNSQYHRKLYFTTAFKRTVSQATSRCQRQPALLPKAKLGGKCCIKSADLLR